ncbi:hypothetical protein I4U23_020467 [Adineta vaga]|nr:hypothetical protein I4U23_020467 [Adineta vaga]
MDVLELPRPVINFLRTMAKESCRYALSWDIFGGPDSVTLTLTWKLIDEESQSSIINEASSSLKQYQQQQQNYDDTHSRVRSTTKTNTSSSSPRRSRRDNHTSSNENASVPAIFRSSRGKSLEDPSIHSSKQMTSHHQHQLQQLQHTTKEHSHVSSVERTTIPNHYHRRTKKEQQQQQQQQQQKQIPTQSDQSYGKLYDARSAPVVKCATVSSLSSSSPSPQPNNNTNTSPSLPATYSHYQRAKPQQPQTISSPTSRKAIRPLTNISRTPTLPLTSPTTTNYMKLKRTDNIATHYDFDDDDDDDVLDPWVKRFECSLEDHDDESTEQSEEKEALPSNTPLPGVDDSANTSGKVKFKTKPDYF